MTTMATPSKVSFEPIGVLRTCFSEKFGAPRQSQMVKAATGVLKLRAESSFREALNHLAEFTHIWVVFVFDRAVEQGWRPTIEPPRIDAPNRVGVFASRSPHRPNPIGLSVVRLDRIDLDSPGGIELHLSGVDILDGTPVLDIKPYLPYADRVEDASSGWAGSEIRRYSVRFSAEALAQVAEIERARPRFCALITELLEWDPRPRSQRSGMPLEDPMCEGRRFGFRIFEYDVQWEARAGGIWVEGVVMVERK